MHEMSLVRSVVEVVLDECKDTDVTSVVRVNLSIGQMRDVVEQYVPELFRYLARGTIAQDAEVTVNRVPLTVRCRDCGDIFPIDVWDDSTWSCPRCGARQRYTIFSGNEFQIDSIEVKSDTPVNDGTMVSVA